MLLHDATRGKRINSASVPIGNGERFGTVDTAFTFKAANQSKSVMWQKAILEMMGTTLTVMKLDGELKMLIDMPCYSMGLK
jgi:hypothetical protein